MNNFLCDVRISTNIEKLDRLVISPEGKVSVEERTEGMPQPGRDSIFGVKLYQFLQHKCFIHADTQKDSFLYLMGFTLKRPASLQQIKWLKTKQLLREMLQQLYANMLNAGLMTFADIERRVPSVFIGTDDKQYELTKNKGAHA